MGAWLGLVLLVPRYARTGQDDAPASSGGPLRTGPGDVLQVAVEGQPDLSGPCSICRNVMRSSHTGVRMAARSAAAEMASAGWARKNFPKKVLDIPRTRAIL